jgi:putative ABC transport system permease protein
LGSDQDDTIVMPIGGMRSRYMRVPPGQVSGLVFQATSADTTDRAVEQIDSILRQRHRIAPGATPDFMIRTQQQMQTIQDAIYVVLTLLLVAAAGISLVVGGIGIMNIMLVSVTERTREIGIRMAIGAREHDIRTQFLVEAVVLSLLGGVAGALVGAGAIAGVSRMLDIPMSMSGLALSVSLAVSGMIGVAFGFFPARRASRLDPIVALRHE